MIAITYVPYNNDLSGAWIYVENGKHVWLSRTWCGSYNIHEINDDMNHIGSFSVDRMLNLDKYDIVSPSGYIKDIKTKRLTRNKKNSVITLCDDTGLAIFTKKVI